MEFGLTFQERLRVRAFYHERMSLILSSEGYHGINKYEYPYLDRMSPIERIAFDECISQGCPMLPEFPVGNYFIDLADPREKLGIELDGADYHTDWVADTDRDAVLWNKYGWRIFRCEGRRCHAYYKEPDENDIRGLRTWMRDTIDGLVYAIHRVFYGSESLDDCDECDLACLYELDRSRRYFDFPVEPAVRYRMLNCKPPRAVKMSDVVAEFELELKDRTF